jgi:hypothetical protein
MTAKSEVDMRLQEYLGKVAVNLASMPAAERAEILQNVEAHVRDALEEQAHGEPSLSDLERVLAEMDPPEAYVQDTPSTGTAAGEAPKIRWQTKLFGVVWAVFFIGMANAASGFGAMFESLLPDTRSLPILTRFVLAVPLALWIVLGLVGGAGVVVKSLFVPPDTSRFVDRIWLLAFLAIGALIVVSLMLPVIRLQGAM